MTVVEHYGEDEKLAARAAMALCSDAEARRHGRRPVGDPTEVALVDYADKHGAAEARAGARSMPRVAEAPFDSMRKMMSTVHSAEGSAACSTPRARPTIVLSPLHAHTGRTGRPRPDDRANARARFSPPTRPWPTRRCACWRWRMRALCSRCPPDTSARRRWSRSSAFLGLAGMIDPIRPEVKAAIVECREAGIRPVMITGDHRDTAVAIAKAAGHPGR